VATEQEQLERDIQRTRQQLGQDVDALAEKVSPAQAARRGVGRAKSALVSVKETVMGSASDMASTSRERTANLGHEVTDTAGQVRESAGQAAQTAGREVRRRTEGNPLAAGVIAFGMGWLVSSLVPATPVEERIGEAVRDVGQDKLGPVKDEVTAAAREVAGQLKEPAQQAAESVKETAAKAAATVKDESSGQAQNLTGRARSAAETVREDASAGPNGDTAAPATPPAPPR
jgi:uncharacterized protein YjbJ (UPF0337 family)